MNLFFKYFQYMNMFSTKDNKSNNTILKTKNNNQFNEKETNFVNDYLKEKNMLHYYLIHYINNKYNNKYKFINFEYKLQIYI